MVFILDRGHPHISRGASGAFQKAIRRHLSPLGLDIPSIPTLLYRHRLFGQVGKAAGDGA